MKANKIKTTILIAVLIISTLAIAIPVSALVELDDILDPEVYPGEWETLDEGPVGTEVIVVGYTYIEWDDAPFKLVEIYWDSPAGEKLGENYSDAWGEFEVNIEIPEDVEGEHYVIVKELPGGATDYIEFYITPEIVLDPESALPGDWVTVTGTGFAAESEVDLIRYTATLGYAVNGYSTWTTDTAYQSEYSVELTTGTTDISWGYMKIPIKPVLLSALTDEPSYWVNETTVLSGGKYPIEGGHHPWGHPYMNLVLDLDGDLATVDKDWLEGIGSTAGPIVAGEAADPLPGVWTEMEVGWGYFDGDDTIIGGDFSGQNMTTGEYRVHTLAEWKTAMATAYPNAKVVEVQICYGLWPAAINSLCSPVYVDDMTIDGVTYALPQEIVDEETDIQGSFEAYFTVPELAYDTYIIYAIDEVPNEATADLEVCATIALDPEEGSSGTVVDISGEGFIVSTVDVFFDEALILDDVAIAEDGTFAASFIVPVVILPIAGYQEFLVEVGAASTLFNVTGTTEITLDPIAVAPDSSVTIEGTGFTAIPLTEVTVDLGPLMGHATFLTDATGCFEGTFMVPTLIPDSYVVNATDENELTAEASLNVAITELTLDPEEGPTGTWITVEGSGFIDNSAFNVTFNDELVFTGETDPEGDLPADVEFIVPTIPVGIYNVFVVDASEISGTATFEVNATTAIAVDPTAALVGYTIDLEGEYFSAGSIVTVLLQNSSSWSEPLTTVSATVTTDIDGTFACTFDVPEVDLGNYVVNATDANGLVATAPFTILESIYVDVSTSSPEYLPGDTVSFQVIAAFAFDIELVIKDPTGYPFTTIGPILTEDWVVMGDYYVVPYAAATFELPSDATEGLWNFTAYDSTGKVDTGTFAVGEVVEPPELPAETTGEETLDSTGNPKTSFALGETVLASAEVTNVGTTSQPMLIVIQLTDPMLRVLAPSYISMTLPPGLSITPSLGFIMPLTGYTTGTWTAKIMILDTWPALGGVPIGSPVTITFTVG